LEFLGSEARVVRLNDRNLVEEPVGPGLIGDVFGAVGARLMPWRYQLSLPVNCAKSDLLRVLIITASFLFK